jgi:hypothetical protein
MSANTTIRARFTTMITHTKTYIVDGLENIKAAQQFATRNNLCLEETKPQPKTAFKVIAQ